MWVGNENNGNGTFTQSAGATTVNNWFAVGRFGGDGTVVLSGDSTLVKQGGGNAYVGERNTRISTMTLRDNATFTANTGEFWVGNGGGNGTLNAAISVLTNWFAIGRAGGGNLVVGGNTGSNGTLVQTGGTLTSNSTWLAEGGNALFDLRAGTASLGDLSVGREGGAGAEVRISGTSAVNANYVRLNHLGTVTGLVNLSGGSLTTTSIEPGTGSGSKTFNFTGGRLTTDTYSLASNLGNSGTGTLAPGGLGEVGATAVTAGYLQGSEATFAIDIAGLTTFDLITAGADSIINGLLSVDVLDSYTLVPGSEYDVLVSATALTGAPLLGGLDGSLFTHSIVNGNTLRLTAVPEPGSLSLLVLAGVAALRRRRTCQG